MVQGLNTLTYGTFDMKTFLNGVGLGLVALLGAILGLLLVLVPLLVIWGLTFGAGALMGWVISLLVPAATAWSLANLGVSLPILGGCCTLFARVVSAQFRRVTD